MHVEELNFWGIHQRWHLAIDIGEKHTVTSLLGTEEVYPMSVHLAFQSRLKSTQDTPTVLMMNKNSNQKRG